MNLKKRENKNGKMNKSNCDTTLQRSWRPLVMLVFAFIVLYSKVIAPLFNLPIAPLEPQFWTLLELGLGGYVIGRSLEKIAKHTNFKKIE